MQFTFKKPTVMDGIHFPVGTVVDESQIPIGARASLRILDVTEPPIPFDEQFADPDPFSDAIDGPQVPDDQPNPPDPAPAPTKSKKS